MCNLGNVLKKLVQLERITDGGLRAYSQSPEAMGVWGRSPQPLGDFLYNFLKKKAILLPLDHISNVFRTI